MKLGDRLRWSILLVVGTASVGAPGCGDSDPCTVMVRRRIECASLEQKAMFEVLQDLEIKSCRDRHTRDNALARAELACSQRSSCSDYDVCMTELREASYNQRVREEVEAALERDQDIDQALSLCLSEPKDPGVITLCGRLFERSFDHSVARLETLRDRGGDPKNQCYDLKFLADRVSPTAKTQAEALCREVDIARRAADAIAEARRNIDTKVPEVPLLCGSVAEDLRLLGNTWAGDRLSELTAACYTELGVMILPAIVPTMQPFCDYQVDQVVRAVRKFELRDPRLDPWVEKAAPRCPG